MLSSRLFVFFTIFFLFICKSSAHSSDFFNKFNYLTDHESVLVKPKNIMINDYSLSDKKNIYFCRGPNISAFEFGFIYGFVGASAGIGSFAATDYALDIGFSKFFPFETSLVCLIATVGAASALAALQYFESDFVSQDSKQFFKKWLKDSWKSSLGVAVGGLSTLYALSMLLPLTGSLLISSMVCLWTGQLCYLNRKSFFSSFNKSSSNAFIPKAKERLSGKRTGLLVDLGLVSSRIVC